MIQLSFKFFMLFTLFTSIYADECDKLEDIQERTDCKNAVQHYAKKTNNPEFRALAQEIKNAWSGDLSFYNLTVYNFYKYHSSKDISPFAWFALKEIHDTRTLDLEYLTVYLKDFLKKTMYQVKDVINDEENLLQNEWFNFYSPFRIEKINKINKHYILFRNIFYSNISKNTIHDYIVHKDVWSIIFSHLDPLDIKAMGQVNRDFYHLTLSAYPKILEYYFKNIKFSATPLTKFLALTLLNRVYQLKREYPYLMECFPKDPFEKLYPRYEDFIHMILDKSEIDFAPLDEIDHIFS